MTPEPETHPVDDLAAYAVDALDPVERAAVESHLAECAGCRHELDRHRSTLSAPAVAEEPPAGVWEGIATRPPDDAAPVPPGPVTPPPPPLPLAGEPHEDDPLRPGLETREVVVVPLPPPAPDIDPVSGSPPPPRHLRRGDGARRAGGRGRSGRLLAAAAVVAVVLGAGAVALRQRDGGADPSVAELAADAAADPESTLVTLTSPTGEPVARVVLADDADFDDDFVLFDDLPALGDDRTYQLWRTDQGVPASLGVLGDGAGGAARVALPDDVSAFALSREPAGGSPAPTDVIAS